MPVVAGRILRLDEVVEGWVRVEGGLIKELGDGKPEERPVATGWIMPSPVNAHTHLGDTALRPETGKPHGLAELVGPGGWKHHHLARLPKDAKQAGIVQAFDEMAAIGTEAFVDFREMGAVGTHILREAANEDGRVAARILGRPDDGSDDALDAVLAAADGLGIPALADIGWKEAERWAEAAHGKKKAVALHVSEGKREDMHHALALEPDFLVHACQATRDDLEEVGAAKVPVVVCPRSNKWFNLKANVPAMMTAGIAVALGTDNGMLHDANVLEEAKLLHALWPKVSVADVLRMVSHNGRIVAGLKSVKMQRGDKVDLVVLPADALAGGELGKPGFVV